MSIGLIAGMTVMLAVPGAASARAVVGKRASQNPVPNGFVGVSVGSPLYPISEPEADVGAQLDTMVASGVETLRLSVEWASTQPYQSWRDVPASDRSRFVDVGGVPTDFSSIDQFVALAAQRGLTVLPTIIDAPSWDGQFTPDALVELPKSDGPYANFLKGLVLRYGPNGSFWNDHSPKLPFRMWQIWNEPNIFAFWPVQPALPPYVTLLRAAHNAIKSVDPSAKIVLAGMPNFSWTVLRRLYTKFPGTRHLFDVVAVHPYTRDPKGVIQILMRVRRVMDKAGDARKPIIADEISWPSSLGKTPHTNGFDFATTEGGQANKVRMVLPLLERYRSSLGLLAFYYYTWVSEEIRDGLAFAYSGLFKFQSGEFVAKPAFQVFSSGALAMERCLQKGQKATVCLRPASGR
jgi:polysaccharide biosynthesis protein PslG